MLEGDFTRVARSRQEKVDLVRAIAAAPADEPETDWIEWKRELNLAEAGWRFEAARQILGFGNRDPAHAARYAAGCAYLVAGVAPQSLTGVEPHDPAKVEDWLERYIARGEPQWSIDYVAVDQVMVMMVTIEAPEQGAPIFTLRKAYNETKAGTIFVRRNGKTEQARPEDVVGLTERARQTGARLGVGVDWHRKPHLVALGHLAELAIQFRNSESDRLPEPWQPGPFDAITGFQDLRDRDTYRAEVDSYLAKAQDRHRWLCEKAAVEEGYATLELAVINPTALNFPRTQVRLTLPSDVRAYTTTREIDVELDDLEPPKPWGAHRLGSSLLIPSYFPPEPDAPPGSEIELLGDDLIITLPAVDVRPGLKHPLEPLYLVLPLSYAGKELTFAWRATSTGADGHREGTLTANVAAEPMTPSLPDEDDDY